MISILQHWRSLAVCTAFAGLLLSRTEAFAHGETHIRIAAMTREIEASTSTNKASLYLARGELYREDQDWPAAEADYTRAAELDPTLERIDICRGLLLADRGDLEAAHKMFDQVLLQRPDSSEASLARARLLVKLGQPSSAVPDYQHAINNVRLPDPEWFRELAQTLRAQGKFDEALATLDEGVRRIPVPIFEELAFEIELQRENFEGALLRLDRVIESAHRKERWLTRRAEVLLLDGRNKEARASLDAALEAITLLPERIQNGPPIKELKAQITNVIARAEETQPSVNLK